MHVSARHLLGVIAALACASFAADANAQRRRRRPRRHHHAAPHRQPDGAAGNTTTSAVGDGDDDATNDDAAVSSPRDAARPQGHGGTPPNGEPAVAAAQTTTATASEDTAPRPPALDIALTGRLFARHLSYTSDLFGQFRNYDLAAGPAAALRIDIFPGAWFTRGAGAHIGITLAGDYAFGISSVYADAPGQTFATQSWGFSGGVRGRVPIGPVELGAVVAYGMQTFTVGAPQDGDDPGVPDVQYQYLRFGLTGRFALGSRVAITAEGAFLYVLSIGEMKDRFFPRATANGAEASLGLAIVTVAGLEVRAGVDIRRYFYGMHSQPGDEFVAGGAVDQYMGAFLGLAWRR
jgi:hypothetical protein